MTAARALPHPFGRLVMVELGLDETLDESSSAIAESLPANVSKLRRLSFVAGRLALLEALAQLGAERSALGRDDRGAPRLPTGFSGSVSHKRRADTGRVVAVALAAQVKPGQETVGVDIETKTPPRPDIASRILTELEQRDLTGDERDWPFVLSSFSVKEAIYKAIDPFLGRYVSFTEATLSALPRAWPNEGGRFVRAELSAKPMEPRLDLSCFLQAVPDEPMLLIASAKAQRLTGS